jgi:hypothetical protein
MTVGSLTFGLLSGLAHAQSTVPDRQVPPTVMSELRLLENQFELALYADCAAERCFSKGCSYVDHAVADRPRATSMPGFGMDPGPGSVDAQEYLTRARCSFAVEQTVEVADAQALARRLQSKLSKGWMVVSVDSQRLQPLPRYLLEAPAEVPPETPAEVPEPPPPPPPPVWSPLRELWTTLLPHLAWMIGVVLVTFAAAALIWAWRRLGQDSLDDRLMLAELARGEPAPAAAAEAPVARPPLSDEDFVAQQDAAWRTKLAAMDPAAPDPEVQALVHELLRAGDLALLAKAVLRFPDTLPAAFPTGGEIAQAKLDLAAYLKSVDASSLPSDADFFRALNRHALAASVSAQSDARVVRSLREDFGAAGLADVISRLPARPGALLFALAPSEEQHELVRLLDPRRVGEMAGMLLRSNRMDPRETQHLFAVVSALRAGAVLPAEPPGAEVTDRGAEIDAAPALSVLLESMHPDRRDALFTEALDRFQGSLPAWHRQVLFSDMLFALSDEARADLLLGVEIEALAAWLSLLDAEARERVVSGLPGSLRSSVRAMSAFTSRSRQLDAAERGRKEIASGLVAQLARSNVRFERALHPVGDLP